MRKNKTMNPFPTSVALIGIFLFSACKIFYFTLTYKWTTMRAVNFDNSGLEPVVTSKDTIAAKVFGIRLELDPVVVDANYRDAKTNDNLAEIIERTADLMEIKIVGTGYFSRDYPPGTILNDLFLAGYKNWYEHKSPISTFIHAINENKNYVYDNFDLVLIREPETEMRHRFIVSIELSNGKVFTDTTAAVFLSKN